MLFYKSSIHTHVIKSSQSKRVSITATKDKLWLISDEEFVKIEQM